MARADVVERHELVGTLDRQWPQQHRVDQAEDGGVGAGAERQRDDGHGGKAALPAEHAQGVSQILERRLDERQAAAIPIDLFDLIDAAEGAQRRVPGVVSGHPSAPVLVDLHLEVAADLVVEIPLEPAAREQGAQAMGVDTEGRHRVPSEDSRNRSMIADARRQCCSSLPSCRRPAGVMA